MKFKQWIVHSVVSMLLIFLFCVVQFINSFALIAMGAFFPPELVGVYHLNKRDYFVYQYGSIAQENSWCRQSWSEVYIKNNYLPILHLVKKVGGVINDIQILDGEVMIIPEGGCFKNPVKLNS
ncbi:MAG: hypothetical protein HRU38_24540 [Saccharospirillaceae bacterium]|nr:hypothetical protein [Pseudomonadales bacterium]NRB81789.1 hypothetical protein [Saccharospirillaceae bacterium]